MSDNLEEIPDQLTEEDIKNWKKKGKIRFVSYGEDSDYVAVIKIDGKELYYRKTSALGKTIYRILPDKD